MISNEEKQALVKMFCAYCRRTLRNARTDILRAQARHAASEVIFSDMHESELKRIAIPHDVFEREVVFDVLGSEIVVLDGEIADALCKLSERDKTVILLYYFAGWTDRQIADALGCPRSTIQFRRSRALIDLRQMLSGEDANDL